MKFFNLNHIGSMTKQVVACGNIYIYLIAFLGAYFVDGAQDELSGLVVVGN